MSARQSRGAGYARQANPHHNAQFSRQWDECPPFQQIGDLAGKIINDTAIRAVEHWLGQADELSGEDRKTALETADSIMKMSGMRWGDLKLKRAA